MVLINTTYICRRNFVQAEGMMPLEKVITIGDMKNTETLKIILRILCGYNSGFWSSTKKYYYLILEKLLKIVLKTAKIPLIFRFFRAMIYQYAAQ